MNQTFTVTGITCGHCEASIKRALTRLDPSAQVQIDRSQGRVDVAGSQQPREALAAAIPEEGYEVAA